MKKTKVVVIGGMNLDVLGMPNGQYIPYDSNIGKVIFRPGGVGRNIATACVNTCDEVSFITAFGDDSNAKMLWDTCTHAGIDVSRSIHMQANTNVYLCIHDDKGDMIAAINDMGLNDALTFSVLAPHIDFINEHDACIVEGNLPQETLCFLAEHVQIPIIADPVSCVKADKFIPVLKNLRAFKPNLLEAQYLSKKETLPEMADFFLSLGLKQLFISLGKDGLYYTDGKTSGIIPSPRVVHTVQTGAGDALLSGLCKGICQQLSIKECATLGVECAYLHLSK